MPKRSRDERIVPVSFVTRSLRRPEFGAIIGALVILTFFSITVDGFFSLGGAARFLDRAAPIGVMAVAVSLLMIGGEFDLSTGVMTGTTGLVMGLLVTRLQINIWVGIVASLVFALSIGFINGFIVVKTSLPSFIVTLGTFFVLRGANLGITKLVTDTVRVEGIDDVPGYELARRIFSQSFGSPPQEINILIFWWLGLTIFAALMLLRSKFGNWVFSVGGDALAARNVGVPVAMTKIGLFMGTSMASWLVGISLAVRFRSVQGGQGIGQEFMYIIASVVGGCLLTGGYGSPIGATVGALIIGMAFTGIAFAGWNTDWLWLFVGVLLLVAVLVNNYVRLQAERAQR